MRTARGSTAPSTSRRQPRTPNRLFERYADLDGDGTIERIELQTDDSSHGGQLKIGDGTQYAYQSDLLSRNGHRRFVIAFEVGQFDHDPQLEVACLELQRESSFGENARVRVIDVGGRGRLTESDIKDLGMLQYSTSRSRDWDRVHAKVVACDFDADGSDAIVVGGRWLGLRVVHMPGTNPGNLQPSSDRRASMMRFNEVVDFTAYTTNGKRREKLAVLRESSTSINPGYEFVQQVRVRPTFQNGAWTGDWTTDQETRIEDGHIANHRVVAGDVDGDSMVLRYTGVKDYLLADPLVIGVLAAAPSWSPDVVPGQDLDSCSTSLEFSSTRGTALTVSSAYTVSASVGYSVDDLFDAFGVEVKATISHTLEQSRTTGSEIRTYTTYIGGSTEDTIVFKGTLYRSYEYRIVGAADDTLIGTHMRIEDPVSTKVFQWSLEKYNQLVEAGIALRCVTRSAIRRATARGRAAAARTARSTTTAVGSAICRRCRRSARGRSATRSRTSRPTPKRARSGSAQKSSSSTTT